MSENLFRIRHELKKSKYLAYNDYTIADIATFPWIARHEWHDIGLRKFKIYLDGIQKYQKEKCYKRLRSFEKRRNDPKNLIINKNFFISLMFFLSFNC